MFMLQHKCILNVTSNFYTVHILYRCHSFTIEDDGLSFFFSATSVRVFLFSAYLSNVCFYRHVVLTLFKDRNSYLMASQVLIQSIGVPLSGCAVLHRMFDAELFLRPRRLPYGQQFIVTMAIYVTRVTLIANGRNHMAQPLSRGLILILFGTAYLVIILKSSKFPFDVFTIWSLMTATDRHAQSHGQLMLCRKKCLNVSVCLCADDSSSENEN
jgi:hypothetical protein